MSTFISGIASCSALDSAGEIVDIKGLDISSLARTGTCNWEHKADTPAQTVGKIIKAKKIYGKSDCENENELYFWKKVELPFVYIVAELLDDYTASAKECAGQFKYSRDNPDKIAILGFSVEGSEIPGTRVNRSLITRSIARKVTLTCSPANKACVAEIYENQKPQIKDDFESIFKSNEEAIILFKSGEGEKLYEQFLAKKEVDLSKAITGHERGIHLPIADKRQQGTSVMGTHVRRPDPTGKGSKDMARIHANVTHREMKNIKPKLDKSEKPAWSQGKLSGDSVHYNHPEHGTVSIQKQPAGEFHVKHQGKLAGLGGVKGSFKSPKEAGAHAKNYMQAISQKKILAPKMQNISSEALLGKSDLKKAIEAGSYNAAPSTLVNGAAYQTEGLSSKQSNSGEHNFQGSKKKDWNKRAKEDYDRWPHKEKFEKFMKARMPHLADGEIRAIGRTIALKKTIDFEKSLNELVFFTKSEDPSKKKSFNPKIRQIAEQHAASKGIKLEHPENQVKVNPKFASKVANAYHNMKHDPNHPDVKRSYDALKKETGEQYKAIKNAGLKVSKIKPGQENSYKSSKDTLHDIHANNHLWFYPTESGFGSNPQQNPSDHPMLEPTTEMHEGKPLLANDMFRIVHDYFGHAKEGNGFGPSGEENAWQNHARMYTPDAQKALTTETRGQNSWVNFGPHGESNRANPSKTIYADQKAGILPDWAHEANPGEIKKSVDLKKSENSSKLDLIHYSSHPNLKEVDPKFKGKGVDATTKGRDTWHPHSFYYKAGTEPESIVTGQSPHKYTASIDIKNRPIYDIGEDKEGHLANSPNMDAAHEKIKEKGYHGFHNSKHDKLSNVVAMYHPLKVNRANK